MLCLVYMIFRILSSFLWKYLYSNDSELLCEFLKINIKKGNMVLKFHVQLHRWWIKKIYIYHAKELRTNIFTIEECKTSFNEVKDNYLLIWKVRHQLSLKFRKLTNWWNPLQTQQQTKQNKKNPRPLKVTVPQLSINRFILYD